jgi:rhodanese-related sulfurtransferase
MSRRGMKCIAGLFILGLLTLVSTTARCQDVQRMSKEELKGMLGNPNLVIIDVRTRADWNASEEKIREAVREDPGKVDSWMGNYPKEKTYVFYCA